MNNNETFRKIKTSLDAKIAEVQNQIKSIELELEIVTSEPKFVLIKDDGTKYDVDINQKPTSKNPITRFKEHRNLKKVKKIHNYVIKENTEILKNAKECLEILIKINRHLSQYGVVTPVENIADYIMHIDLLRTIIDVNLEDLRAVLVECVRKNYEKYANNQSQVKQTIASQNQVQINEMESCLILGKYFNKKGAMLPGDTKTFQDAFNKLFAHGQLLDEEIQKMFKNYNMLAFNDVIDLLTSELEEVNQAALAEKTKKDEYLKRRQAEAEAQRIEHKLQKKALKRQKDALSIVNQYYQNGTFIKIPTNPTEFINILKEAHLPAEQEAKILRLLGVGLNNNNNNNNQLLFQKYLSSTDIELLNSVMQSKQESLIYFVSSIEEIILLLEETENDEDYTILMQYLNENINNIKYSLIQSNQKAPTLKPQV